MTATPDWSEISRMVAVVVVPVIIAAGGWWVTSRGKKGDQSAALLDQYQEDRKEDRARIDALAAKVGALEREVLKLLTRDAQWSLHVDRLEAQIVGLDAVPIARPDALREAT